MSLGKESIKRAANAGGTKATKKAVEKVVAAEKPEVTEAVVEEKAPAAEEKKNAVKKPAAKKPAAKKTAAKKPAAPKKTPAKTEVKTDVKAEEPKVVVEKEEIVPETKAEAKQKFVQINDPLPIYLL